MNKHKVYAIHPEAHKGIRLRLWSSEVSSDRLNKTLEHLIKESCNSILGKATQYIVIDSNRNIIAVIQDGEILSPPAMA